MEHEIGNILTIMWNPKVDVKTLLGFSCFWKIGLKKRGGDESACRDKIQPAV
jgi:hypothetical protein